MKFFHKDIELEIPEGVYEPREDSTLLITALEDNIKTQQPETVLEVGCGSGLASIFAAKSGANVTSIDLNPEAVEATKLNAQINNVDLEVFQSDLFSNLNGHKFDLILFNAPYLKTDDSIDGKETWEDNGIISKFISSVNNYLNPRGRILLVTNTQNDIDHRIRHLAETGIHSLITHRKKIAWEELVVIYGRSR